GGAAPGGRGAKRGAGQGRVAGAPRRPRPRRDGLARSPSRASAPISTTAGSPAVSSVEDDRGTMSKSGRRSSAAAAAAPEVASYRTRRRLHTKVGRRPQSSQESAGRLHRPPP